MDYPITFHFRGQAYTAKAHLSLQEDGCYIFTFLDDPNLIDEFGPDVDIHTDCVSVLPDEVTNDKNHGAESSHPGIGEGPARLSGAKAQKADHPQRTAQLRIAHR